jgi:hypothetical protein
MVFYALLMLGQVIETSATVRATQISTRTRKTGASAAVFGEWSMRSAARSSASCS